MSASAADNSRREPRPAHDRLIQATTWLLLGLTGAWTLHLFPEWRSNPDLSHGLITPLVFLYLLHEARVRGTARYLPGSSRLTLAIAVVLGLAIGLLLLAGLYAAAVDWTHALVSALLGGSLCALLSAGWLALSQDRVRVVPFNWPAFTAIAVWALSAPLPPGTYARLTLHLQGVVTQAVVFSLHLLGIAAARNGNVIELPHATVGVEEACSGVRSLVSCVFVGVFLSGALLRGPLPRVAVILVAAPLAVVMNFIRSLGLTLLAEQGVDIRGAWHDLTGFAVLGVTAVILGALAYALRPRRPTGPGPADAAPLASAREGRTGVRLVFTGTLLATGAVALFVLATRPAPRLHHARPDLARLLPAESVGWDVTTRSDLYRFSAQLQTDTLVERTYVKARVDARTQLTVYVAYWPPGQASVSLVASHTPDACWPGVGWSEDEQAGRRALLHCPGITLPPAEQRVFTLDQYPQHVWYWHLYDGKPVHHEGLESPSQLLSLAWRYGFRKGGEQVFIRISSNRPWAELSDEPLLAEILHQMQSLGLKPVAGARAETDAVPLRRTVSIPAARLTF